MWAIPSTIKVHRSYSQDKTSATFRKNSGMWQRTHIRPSSQLRKIEDVQNPVYRAKGEIMSLTDKVSQMAKKREQLYADYVAGVVDSEDYQLIREDYSRQYDGLRAALQEAENKKVQVEQQIEEYLNMTSHLEEHLDNFEFDIKVQRWIRDFYDTAGGRQRDRASGTGGSNASAGMVHIK